MAKDHDTQSAARGSRRRRKRTKRDRAWYLAAMVVPTFIAHRLPLRVREFVHRRAVRGV